MSDRYKRFLDQTFPKHPAAPIDVPAPEVQGDFHNLSKFLNEPDKPEELPAWRQYGAMGLRGLSGLIGAEPLIGGVATGAGEVGAEMLEGRFSPAEILAAGAVGAAGGGLARSVMAAKTPLQAAARAVPWAAAAPVAHHLIAEGDLPSAQEELTGIGLGAGAAYGTGKLLQWLGVYGPKAAPAVEHAYEVESNAPRGGTIRRTSGGAIITDHPPAPIKSPTAANITAAGAPHVGAPVSDMEQAAQQIEELQNYQREAGHAEQADMQDPWGQPTASRSIERGVEKEARAQKLAAKAQAEAQSALAIKAAKEAGLEAGPATITERLQAPNETGTGTETLTRRYAIPQDEEGNVLGDAQGINDLIDNALQTTAEQAPEAAAARGASTIPVLGSERLGQLFDAGTNGTLTFEQLQEAQALNRQLRGGEVPPAAPAAPAVEPFQRNALDEAFDRKAARRQMMAEAPGPNFAEQPTITGSPLNNVAEAPVVGRRAGDIAPEAAAPQMTTLAPATRQQQLAELLSGGATKGPQTFTRGVNIPQNEPEDLLKALFSGLKGRAQAAEAEAPAAVGESTHIPQDPTTGPPVDVAPTVPSAPEESSNPLAFFKSRVDASGEHYRQLKEAFAGVPKEQLPTDTLTGRNPLRLAGKGLQQEAEAANLPTRGGFPVRAAEAATEPVAQEAAQQFKPLDLKSALADIDKAKGRGPSNLAGGGFGKLSSFLKGESGQADPMVMVKLGLTAAGAAAGSAMDDRDPITGAFLGGALGLGAAVALPKLATQLSTLAQHARVDPATVPPDVRPILDRIKTPEGFATVAKEAVNLLPAYLRANLLATPNIFSNAFLAPYGAGLMAGVERHLAGDPQGIEMIRAMNPAQWAQRFKNSWDQATDIIENAELASLERAGGATNPNSKLGRALGFPGTFITTGDVTTRNSLMEGAGLTDEAARRITMNNEPEAEISKATQNYVRRGGVLGSLFLPFSKTMLNYMERGVERTPVVGLVAHALSENPDPLTHVMVQQMLGSAFAGGGAAAGYYDPTSDPRSTKLLRGAGLALAGQYGLPAAMGYAAGKAFRAGNTPGQAAKAAYTAGTRQLPMPSMDIPNAFFDFITGGKAPKEFIPGGPAMRSIAEPDKGRKPRESRHNARKPRG